MRLNLMDHGGRCRRMAAMGPHPQQQSMQQSTNFICNESTSLKLEKKIITSNMTIIACPVDDDVQQQQCRDVMLGTMQPAG